MLQLLCCNAVAQAFLLCIFCALARLVLFPAQVFLKIAQAAECTYACTVNFMLLLSAGSFELS
jgi:hypothetical protein